VAAKWANILTDEFSNQGVMEQELQIPSCLFGGPPVRDDIIKLGESQIGFINIFARPLFEGVADILPGMAFAVEEMVINKSTWDDRIETTRQSIKKNPKMHLGQVSPGFASDPNPSPFTNPTARTNAEPRTRPTALETIDSNTSERPDRQASSSSLSAHPSTSHNALLAIDKSTSIPGSQSPTSFENQSQSRRGSADPNLTTIVVTQTPNATAKANVDGNADPVARPASPSRRIDTLTHSSPNKASGKPAEQNGGIRPLTAPSAARHSQGKSSNPHNARFFRAPRPFGVGPDNDPATNLYPLPHPSSQSHSEVDLTHTVNGSSDGPKASPWEANKYPDSQATRSDAFRESGRKSEWWRLTSRRRAKDQRNRDADMRGQEKDVTLDPSILQSNTEAISPTSASQCRNSKTEKLKTFFKRKQRSSDDQEKQLSSFGSSSQLRTPPTSDPGRSINSDD
jgi:3',5'-cyclic-nucleotide phosphodiesterase